MEPFCKLTLLAPLMLEEVLVDVLLEFDDDLEFAAGVVYAHASGTDALSLVEQVTGRKRKIRFEIVTPQTELAPLLKRLEARLKGCGVHYTVEAVHAQGQL